MSGGGPGERGCAGARLWVPWRKSRTLTSSVQGHGHTYVPMLEKVHKNQDAQEKITVSTDERERKGARTLRPRCAGGGGLSVPGDLARGLTGPWRPSRRHSSPEAPRALPRWPAAPPSVLRAEDPLSGSQSWTLADKWPRGGGWPGASGTKNKRGVRKKPAGPEGPSLQARGEPATGVGPRGRLRRQKGQACPGCLNKYVQAPQ